MQSPLLLLLSACLLALPVLSAGNPPMVNADDLAKDEVNLLGSHPQLLPGFKARDVFAGGYQSAIISDSGEFYYWGLVANAGVEAPQRVLLFDRDNEAIDGVIPTISRLSLGSYHILAVDDNGKLYSMGRGEGGMLGHGDDIDVPAPKLIDGLKKRTIKLAAAGYGHNAVLTDTGLFTWGGGERGQLGNGAFKTIDTPKLLRLSGISAKHITDVCTGGYHTALLTDAGELYTFGGNSFGALGLGHRNDVAEPTLVRDLADIPIQSIACGGDHTLALSRDGSLYAWGWGEKGQIGTGFTENVLTPHKIDFDDLLDAGDKIVSITAGGYATSFVVTEKGQVFAFGWGEFGILGNGGSDDALVPTLIPGLKNVVKIATGYKHALALTREGEIYVFGEDTYGSLGLGGSTDTHHSTPAAPPSGSESDSDRDHFRADHYELEDSLASEMQDSRSIPTSVAHEEVILPSYFRTFSFDDARQATTLANWKNEDYNDTSGVMVFHPRTGFKEKTRSEIIMANAWAVGVASQEKAPNQMEDYAVVIDRYGKELNDGFTRVFFGVYDGHGGKSVANFAAHTFHRSLLQELQNASQTTEQALTTAYEYSNYVVATQDAAFTGSTALTCMSVRNGTHHFLYTANAGDSRAVLSRGGKAIRLSYDHKASDEAETDRVVRAGGTIARNRVAGVLAITRALGDTSLSGPVIATPHVDKHEILPLEDEYLILASDGLWDVIEDQEAVDMIRAEQDAQKASKTLLKTALDRGSGDDITVLAIRVVRPLFLG